MNAFLMHPDRDFDLEQGLAWNAQDLTEDLELETLLRAMSGSDVLVHDVARVALLSGAASDIDTIAYRQAVLKDCLEHPAAVRELYDIAGDALDRRRGRWLGIFSHYASGILSEAISLMQMLVDELKKVRQVADRDAGGFASKGFTTLWSLVARELTDAYFAAIQEHLAALQFRKGVLLSAELDEQNACANYVLRKPHGRRNPWFGRLLRKRPQSYTFHLDPRDEAGARMLGEMHDRGVNATANALAQSTDHVLSFFQMLRTELAFYVGCLNLRDRLAELGEPICFPTPEPAGRPRHRFAGLYDVCLALTMARRIVGNAVDADGRRLVIVTGANQGGKSTFLRSIGIAQVMMQSGMFVPAETFSADLTAGVVTHYRRGEDTAMVHGKLDEELARMARIAGRLAPRAMLLFNESFASTNEREGSEIARQIVSALLDSGIKVFFVTHLHEFARSMVEAGMDDRLFLRAERLDDGTRTFRLVEGAPLETSYGEDLYRQVFGEGMSDSAHTSV